jgi:hypothetical protein
MNCKLLIYIIFSGVLLTCCTSGPTEKKRHLVKVNAYTITSEEVDSRLKFEAELNSNFYVSEDTRAEFVKNLIQSQLLIQEAKKQNLDQREIFRQTIQRYWESTLIRDLLAEKGAQLRKTTVVTREETEEYYRKNKEYLPAGTFDDLQTELARKIEDQKVSARLASWIEELKAGAEIEIKDAGLATRVNSMKRKDG